MNQYDPIDYDDQWPEWVLNYEQKEGEYFLDEPNRYVQDISDLQFGRKDYDKYESTDPACPWSKFKRPLNWRQMVNDPYAGKRIADDIDYITITKEARAEGRGYLAFRPIYDVNQLETLLIHHPEVIRIVRDVVMSGYRSLSFKPLRILLSDVFRSQFRPLFYETYGHQTETVIIEGRDAVIPSCDVRWKQACKQFDLANDLIARWLCRHYTINQEEWTPRIAEHADLRQYYKH